MAHMEARVLGWPFVKISVTSGPLSFPLFPSLSFLLTSLFPDTLYTELPFCPIIHVLYSSHADGWPHVCGKRSWRGIRFSLLGGLTTKVTRLLSKTLARLERIKSYNLTTLITF